MPMPPFRRHDAAADTLPRLRLLLDAAISDIFAMPVYFYAIIMPH